MSSLLAPNIFLSTLFNDSRSDYSDFNEERTAKHSQLATYRTGDDVWDIAEKKTKVSYVDGPTVPVDARDLLLITAWSRVARKILDRGDPSST